MASVMLPPEASRLKVALVSANLSKAARVHLPGHQAERAGRAGQGRFQHRRACLGGAGCFAASCGASPGATGLRCSLIVLRRRCVHAKDVCLQRSAPIGALGDGRQPAPCGAGGGRSTAQQQQGCRAKGCERCCSAAEWLVLLPLDVSHH